MNKILILMIIQTDYFKFDFFSLKVIFPFEFNIFKISKMPKSDIYINQIYIDI